MKHILMILLASAMAACGQVQYAFTNFAGLPGGAGNVDGTGSAARFNGPSGVAVDTNGIVYVAERYNDTIRKITSAGVVTTLATSFNQPGGIAVDNGGNVYVADTYNHEIRKITPSGVVTTLAGDGIAGSDDGTGSAARFNYPAGVAVDSATNLYVTDNRNDTIRKITPVGTDWVVTTLAGTAGVSGTNDGTGSEAQFRGPRGVTVDSATNVYVADYSSHTIRKITPVGTNWVVTTLAGSAGLSGTNDGTGSAARFYRPEGVAVDSTGNVYVSDSYNHTIRKITLAGEVTTLAGSAGQFGNADGTGIVARFNSPSGVAVDNAGNVYVSDGNNTIRTITPAGAVSTLAGNAGYGSNDGIGSAARFGSFYGGPAGVAVDSAGNVYVADTYNFTIRKITSAGAVTTLAGSAGVSGSNDDTGSAARFGAGQINGPSGVAVDSAGNIYVADTYNYTIRQITPVGTNWVVTTLAGSAGLSGTNDGTGSAARFSHPEGVAVDSATNVYVADTANHTIRKITPAGAVTTLAGSVGQGGSTNGTGSAARFSSPAGVAVDSAGNVYVADTYSYTIRKITPAGVVTTLAGLSLLDGGGPGSADGIGSAARFDRPEGVAVDSATNVYVADTYNNRITKGTPLLLRFDTGLGILTVSNGFFLTRLTGPSGSNVVVEASANLAAWTPFQTNTLAPDGLSLSVPMGTNQYQFFRARLAP